MASVIYLRGRNWRLRQGDDGKGRDLSKRIHSSWKTGGTEEKLADLNTYPISPHETKSVRPVPGVARYWCVTPAVVHAVCVCVTCVCPQHRSGCTAAWTATSSFSTWPGSPTRWSSSPSQRDSPRFWLRRLSVRQNTRQGNPRGAWHNSQSAVQKNEPQILQIRMQELCQRRYGIG